MAVAAAAALLDELMGRSRNEVGNPSKKEVRWTDPIYCKYYLVQFCPHDLFVNTRADLGPCSKIHCDEAKAQCMKADTYLKVQYEDEFLKLAQNMIHEVERKIAKGEQRLALMGQTDAYGKLTTQQTQKNEDQIVGLTNRINRLVKDAEQAGISGNVDEAQKLMKECDSLKEERESLRKQNENSNWLSTMELAVSQEKQMEVCKVCGAFLIVGDAQSRIDDHLQGKQHSGYGRLKLAVEEITKRRQDAKAEKERKREEERQKRIADRERDMRGSSRGTSDRRRDRSRSPRSTGRNDRRIGWGSKNTERDSRRDAEKDSRNGTRYNRDRTRDLKETRDKDRQRGRDQRSSVSNTGSSRSGRSRSRESFSKDGSKTRDLKEKDSKRKEDDERGKEIRSKDRDSRHKEESHYKDRDSRHKEERHSDNRHKDDRHTNGEKNKERSENVREGDRRSRR